MCRALARMEAPAMTWDPELNAMCTIPITWTAWNDDRALGVRGYKIPRTVLCFIGPSASAANGVYAENLPRQLVIMPPFDANGAPITTVSARDKITLPSGYGFDEPLSPPIRDAHAVFDERGSLHHFEVNA